MVIVVTSVLLEISIQRLMATTKVVKMTVTFYNSQSYSELNSLDNNIPPTYEFPCSL